MLEPKIEIQKLSTETPKKILNEEIKRTWLEENPGKKPDDFAIFKSNSQFSSWESNTLENIKMADEYSKAALNTIPLFEKADSKLKLEIDFGEKLANNIYKKLLDQFNTAQFFSDTASWAIPKDAGRDWGVLVDITKAQVQRNATELSSVVTTCRTLAREDIKQSDPKDPNAAVKMWEGTKLYDTLTKLETALKSWDDFLASHLSFVNYGKMRNIAEQCADRFADFATEHKELYKTFKGADGEPLYVKYQLLATTKALAEKVASQYAARASASLSFSAMYNRIIDVPRTVTTKDALAKSKDLAEYSDNANPGLGKAWKNELSLLGKELRAKDKNTFKDLDAAFKELSKPRPLPDNIDPPPIFKIYTLILDQSLDFWSTQFAHLPEKEIGIMESFQTSTKSIAFGVTEYKQTVDKVLAAKEFDDIRQKYHKLFDGFTMKIQSGIELCLEIG